MKKIKIAHLYYDLMNLYGENGNIRYLTNELEKQNIKTEIHFLSLEDNINFNDYESMAYFQKILRNSGIIDALEEKGIKDGDTVNIYDVEFDYYK